MIRKESKVENIYLLCKKLYRICHKMNHQICHKRQKTKHKKREKKEYLVTINGISYEVTVEERKPKRDRKLPVGVKKVKAGVSGNISRIEVRVGDSVKRGEELFLLKAMNMDLPVVAFANGVIADILVHEKQPVKAGDVLLIFYPV